MNAWLVNLGIFQPSKYITALKTSANIARDKVALAKANMKNGVPCRICHVQKETLEHTVGQSIYTKKLIIKNHNKIKDFIMKRTLEKEKEAVITGELTLRS
jgi:hypothetical protein